MQFHSSSLGVRLFSSQSAILMYYCSSGHVSIISNSGLIYRMSHAVPLKIAPNVLSATELHDRFVCTSNNMLFMTIIHIIAVKKVFERRPG
jgi:hypothetical protein